MSAFVLKIIACISMFIDHIGYVIFDGNTSWFNYIGRIAFPIFAFQISEGYRYTKNIKKYLTRLIICAIISQIPFMLFLSIINNSFGINVIFTLIFGLISIIIYDKYNKYLGITTAISLGIIAETLKFDYGFYGIITTFLFYATNKNKKRQIVSFLMATIIYYIYNTIKYCLYYGINKIYIISLYYVPFLLSTLMTAFFIFFYNNKKGKNTKYILYLFYPIHLMIIYYINKYI